MIKGNVKNRIVGVFLALILMISTLILFACGKSDSEDHYNIVLTNATVPPMMATLSCLESEDTTYMWYGRQQTFTNPSKLGFEMLENSDAPSAGISSQAIDEISNMVLDLYMQNEKVTFDFYVTDYAVEAAFKIFVEQNIPEANYNVHLLEDGVGSYISFEELYGSETGSTAFEEDLANLENVLKEVKAGTYNYTVDQYHYDLTYAYATYDNVDYWLQYPEFLESEDQAMTEAKGQLNTVKSSLTQMFNSLSEQGQQTFKEAVFDTDYVDPIMKQDNGKKTLVVCGTSFTGEEFGSLTEGLKNGTVEQKFEKFFTKILQDYPDYNIVIKPHPSWGLDDPNTDSNEKGAGWTSNDCEGAYQRRVEFCQENNIKVLPGQVPMEVLIWAYGDDIKIGGYSSTLYMNAEPNMTLFFILGSNDFSALGQPLPKLIENGALGDSVRIYYPNGDEVLSQDYDFTAEV